MSTRTVILLALAFSGLCACSDKGNSDDDDSAAGAGAPNAGAGGAMAPAAPIMGAGDPMAGAPAPGMTGMTPPATPPADGVLPIVFVHGFAGSAQQLISQAMRYEANGWPAGHIRAYEHHGGMSGEDFVAGLTAFVDGVLAELSVPQVYLIGHSRGTGVSSMYLGDPARAAKIAKYISLDGSGCAAAMTAGVPCIGPNQAMLPGQAHVEVATSFESFLMQFKFLTGRDPAVTAIVKQDTPVVISGRAVNFPENTGRAGTMLEVWEIDPQTGHRTGAAALATFAINETGNWGPVTVDPDKYYEMVLSADGSKQHHFYFQRFLRSTPFVRLLSGPPDTPARMNTNVSDDHSTLIVSRMREWKTSDILEISTTSPAAGDQPVVNAIAMGVGRDAGFASIGIHIHDDAATPKESSLGLLPWFSTQAFQTGVDVYMPATDPPDGTITVTSMPRGDTMRPQTLHLPNWRSTEHTSSLAFSDYAQD
jgi:pimeloyl-ACP methyl ester carboxylesterase